MKGMLIHFEVADGKQTDFESAMGIHASNILTRDPSYALYSLARVKDSDVLYVLMQRFESWETQLAHQSYDYVQEMMPKIDACLAGPPRVELLDIVL